VIPNRRVCATDLDDGTRALAQGASKRYKFPHSHPHSHSPRKQQAVRQKDAEEGVLHIVSSTGHSEKDGIEKECMGFAVPDRESRCSCTIIIIGVPYARGRNESACVCWPE